MQDVAVQRPVVLYDGKCGFCKRHIARWSALSADRIEYCASQDSYERFPQLHKQDLDRAVHLVETDGTVRRGADAVFRIASISDHPFAWWCYRHLPGFAAMTEAGYDWVASHRNFVDPIDRWLFGKSTDPTSHRLTISIFLRALGVIYFIAFMSLWVQIHGLIGSGGILSITSVASTAPPGIDKWLANPSLIWLNSSDGMLTFLCAGGCVMSVLLIAGVLPLLMLIGLWAFYLSLTIAGQDFLQFQWDSLLLEAGFASLFLAPLHLFMRSRTMREPSHIGIWLLRWVAFRIMFLSGVTKIVAGDTSWLDGTAL